MLNRQEVDMHCNASKVFTVMCSDIAACLLALKSDVATGATVDIH